MTDTTPPQDSPDASSQNAVVMPEARARRLMQGSRDMVVAMGIIVIVMFATIGFTGLCTFHPGKPENGPVQAVDADTILGLEARAMDFPVRRTPDPEGWITNSARRTTVRGYPAVVQGWVTARGMYIQVVQTDQVLDYTMDTEESEDTEYEEAPSITIGSSTFEVRKADAINKRDVWGTDLGDVRAVFSGTADDEEFQEIIEAFLKTDPLPTESLSATDLSPSPSS